MTFRIATAENGKPRLISDERLRPEDFHAVAGKLDQPPIRARKIGFVAARQAWRRETVETHWNGRETTNTAQPRDWIVTNLSAKQEPLRDRDGSMNTYVISGHKFPDLYEPTSGRSQHGSIYRAKGVVEAIEVAGGFDILAPWGERQRVSAGYLLLNGEEVYGNNAETFRTTYEVLSGPA